MLTTTVAGRTWNFKKAVGRNAAAGNGFTQPNKRIGKVTMDDQFLGDFGHSEFTWPVALAVDSEGNLFCSDEHLNTIAIYNEDGERKGG